MHDITNKMNYIYKWSNSLLEICDILDKALVSWDNTLDKDNPLHSSNLYSISKSNSHCLSDEELSLELIMSTILTNDWNVSNYQHNIADIAFNPTAHQMINELKMYVSELETLIGKMDIEYIYSPVPQKLLLIRLLAERGLKLSESPIK